MPACIGSAGNGELPLPNKTLERAWFRYPDSSLTALPRNPWLCLVVCEAPFLSGRRELAFALGKDDGLVTCKLVFGHHIAHGAVWALLIIVHDKLFDQSAGIAQRERRP